MTLHNNFGSNHRCAPGNLTTIAIHDLLCAQQEVQIVLERVDNPGKGEVGLRQGDCKVEEPSS